MKIKKEYIILFLVIAALLLYIVLRKGNRIQYDMPELTQLKPGSISGIVIEGDGKEVRLHKDNDKWLIGPEKYLADAYKVKKMVAFLAEPVLMSVVSDSNDYMRYGLDKKNRLVVKALSGDKPERTIEIGNEAEIRDYTFIKLVNDNRVYHARENLRDIFSTDIDDIRDKTVLSFNIDKTDSVSLTRDGKELVFNKKAIPLKGEEDKNKIVQWETGDGKVIDDALMKSVLDDILGIKCAKYLYDIKKAEMGSPVYVIRVRDEKEHVLTVFPKKEDDYTAESSDNPTVFSLYAWRIDNIIKKFDKMLGNEGKNGAKSD